MFYATLQRTCKKQIFEKITFTSKLNIYIYYKKQHIFSHILKISFPQVVLNSTLTIRLNKFQNECLKIKKNVLPNDRVPNGGFEKSLSLKLHDQNPVVNIYTKKVKYFLQVVFFFLLLLP